MAIVRVKYDKNTKPTEEQIRMLEEAAKRPIVYDEDCPEYSEEELDEMPTWRGDVPLDVIEKETDEIVKGLRKV